MLSLIVCVSMCVCVCACVCLLLPVLRPKTLFRCYFPDHTEGVFRHGYFCGGVSALLPHLCYRHAEGKFTTDPCRFILKELCFDVVYSNKNRRWNTKCCVCVCVRSCLCVCVCVCMCEKHIIAGTSIDCQTLSVYTYSVYAFIYTKAGKITFPFVVISAEMEKQRETSK